MNVGYIILSRLYTHWTISLTDIIQLYDIVKAELFVFVTCFRVHTLSLSQLKYFSVILYS